jgi:hypothetical protein
VWVVIGCSCVTMWDRGRACCLLRFASRRDGRSARVVRGARNSLDLCFFFAGGGVEGVGLIGAWAVVGLARLLAPLRFAARRA